MGVGNFSIDGELPLFLFPPRFCVWPSQKFPALACKVQWYSYVGNDFGDKGHAANILAAFSDTSHKVIQHMLTMLQSRATNFLYLRSSVTTLWIITWLLCATSIVHISQTPLHDYSASMLMVALGTQWKNASTPRRTFFFSFWGSISSHWFMPWFCNYVMALLVHQCALVLLETVIHDN